MAKYYCGESVGRAATLALQLHGGAGLMEESPVERYFRDAREATIPEGTTQMQILHLGKHLLGVSASALDRNRAPARRRNRLSIIRLRVGQCVVLPSAADPTAGARRG